MRTGFYVGEWLAETDRNRLVRGNERVKLDPKAMQVLSFLAEHPQEVVTKEDLTTTVWDGAFVSDEVLTTAVWGLRKALGDDAKEPRYIQTVPRKGYRLIFAGESGYHSREPLPWKKSSPSAVLPASSIPPCLSACPAGGSVSSRTARTAASPSSSTSRPRTVR